MTPRPPLYPAELLLDSAGPARATLPPLATEYDGVDRMTWIRGQPDAGYHPLTLCVGKPDGGRAVLYLTTTYQGVTPLGVLSCSVVSDAHQLDRSGGFTFDLYYPQSRGQLPTVTERSTAAVIDPADVAVLEAIAKSGGAVIRFRGPEQHRQYELSSADRRAMRDVLAAYNLEFQTK